MSMLPPGNAPCDQTARKDLADTGHQVPLSGNGRPGHDAFFPSEPPIREVAHDEDGVLPSIPCPLRPISPPPAVPVLDSPTHPENTPEKKKKSSTIVALLPVLGVALLGVLYLRATPYVFLLGAPALCQHLSRSGPGRSSWTLRQVSFAAVVFAALSLAWAVNFDRLSPYRWGWGVDDSKFPVAAANLLSAGRLPGRLYNDYSSGSYLIYRLPPEAGVFQDGRLQAYPTEFMARFNTQFSQEEWPGLLG